MPSDLWFVALFSIATAVALVARRLKVPYTVSLVFAGLILGATGFADPPELGEKLLYQLFLPGLLFEAAYHLAPEELRKTKARVVALAVPGVVIGMLLTAALLAAVGRAGGEALPFRYGLVFAAIVAATDPIAVVALFKELGAPRALGVLVEAESLLNDGTAIVLFSVVMSVVTGGESSLLGALWFFVRVVGIGIAIGAAFGMAAVFVMKRVDDAMIEITLTTIAAYGSFSVAEHVHGSGVLATVTAGLICGGYAARVAMNDERPREAVSAFWDYVAFALNSLVFLLVGVTVHARALLAHWQMIAVAFVVSLLARAAVVFLVSFALRRTREHIPWSWSAVLTWGGLRGALSMVLAIGLPRDFPHRESIVAMTFGVVILSLFAQGLSIARLLRWFRIAEHEA